MLAPYLENLICFIPFFMIHNRAVGSQYFAKLDAYLLYVLLFAIVYGQQQAIFSALLATAGYCFRQMYNQSGLEVLMDYSTYIWMAQLFILGMVVGYMRDQIHHIKKDDQEEISYLHGQLGDMTEINDSNVRMKQIFELQLVNQKDSLGKIYEITSSLDQYGAYEVLFYAAQTISKLMNTEDCGGLHRCQPVVCASLFLYFADGQKAGKFHPLPGDGSDVYGSERNAAYSSTRRWMSAIR